MSSVRACRDCSNVADGSDNVSDVVERDVSEARAPGVANNSDVADKSDKVSDAEKHVSDGLAPGVENIQPEGAEREEDLAVESDPVEQYQDRAPSVASEHDMNIDVGGMKIDFDGHTEEQDDPLGRTAADQASDDIPREIPLPSLEALAIKCAPESSVAGQGKKLPLEIDSEIPEALHNNPTPQSESNEIPSDSDRDSLDASPKSRSKTSPPRTDPHTDRNEQEANLFGVTADTEQSPSSRINVKHLELPPQVDPLVPFLSTIVTSDKSPSETCHTAQASSERIMLWSQKDESSSRADEPLGKDARPTNETTEEASVSSMTEIELTTDKSAVISHGASVLATTTGFDNVSPSEVDQVTQPCSKHHDVPARQDKETRTLQLFGDQNGHGASSTTKAEENALPRLPHTTMDPSRAPGAFHITPRGRPNNSSSDDHTVDEMGSDETVNDAHVTADQEDLPELKAVVIDEDFEQKKIDEAAQKLMSKEVVMAETISHEVARRRTMKNRAILCFFVALLTAMFAVMGVVLSQRRPPKVDIEELDRLEYLRDVLSRNLVEQVEYLPFDTQDNSTTIPERVFAWLVDHDPLDWNMLGESLDRRIVRRYAIISSVWRLLNRFPSEMIEHSDDECYWNTIVECKGDDVVSFGWADPAVPATVLPELSLLKELTLLVLRDCNLTQFPPSITSLSNLEYIDLLGNSLSIIPWESLSNMSHLDSLDLSLNMLSGSLPSNVGEWWPNMTAFGVRGNENLSGNLPQSTSRWSQLKVLILSETSLDGPLPTNTQWSSMKYFNVSYSNFSGVLPDEIGEWSSLNSFDVSFNSFSGTIPESIVNASLLQEVWLDNNYFTGTMPFCDTPGPTPMIFAACQDVECECCFQLNGGIEAAARCNATR